MKTTLKRFLVTLFAMLMVLSLSTGFASNDPTSLTYGNPDIAEEARYGGTLDLVWMGCSDNFDPHYTTGWATYYWAQNVYETPLSRDNSGAICPNVCEYELSEDGTVLKLWVRDGVTFHDGSLVEIDDVVASLARAGSMVNNLKKYFAGLLVSCDVADGVATYTFSEYTPNTMYYISGDQCWSGIMPKEIAEKYPEGPINVVEDCIGTGPYYLDTYESNVRYGLKRFDGYVPVPEGHDGLAAPKKGYMDAINIWINTDDTSVAMGVIGGEYDSYFISSEFLDQAAAYGLSNLNDTQVNMQLLSFNTKSNRLVNDINLRKAIAAALDFEELMEIEWGEDHYKLVGNTMSGAAYETTVFDEADWYGKANVELAKEYLAKSSYNGETLKMVVDTGNLAKAPVLMVDELAAAGIKLELIYMDVVSVIDYYSNNENDYDMFLENSAKNSYSPCVLPAKVRTTFWGNEEKDALLAEMMQYVPGSDEAVECWQRFAKLWADECAIVNMGEVYFTWTTAPDLNPNMDGTTWRYFWNSYWNDPAARQ